MVECLKAVFGAIAVVFKTSVNCLLSRLPVACTSDESSHVPEQTYVHFAQNALLLDNNIIKQQTMRDPTLSRVLSYIRNIRSLYNPAFLFCITVHRYISSTNLNLLVWVEILL